MRIRAAWPGAIACVALMGAGGGKIAEGAPPDPAPLEKGARKEDGSALLLHTRRTALPEGPLWRKPGVHSRWEIRRLIRTERGWEPPRDNRRKRHPHKIVVTRHGKDVSQQALCPDGLVQESWVIGGTLCVSAGGSPEVFLCAPSEDPEEPDQVALRPTGEVELLREFEWLNAGNFVGESSIGRGMGLVFAEVERESLPERAQLLTMPPGLLKGLHACRGVRAAVVDASTRLPVYLQLGAELRQYAFEELPMAPLEIPGKVSSFLERMTSGVIRAPLRTAP